MSYAEAFIEARSIKENGDSAIQVYTVQCHLSSEGCFLVERLSSCCSGNMKTASHSK